MGNWLIEYSGGKDLVDVAYGHTSVRSDVITGTCTLLPGNKSRLTLHFGSTQIASVVSGAAAPAHWNGGVCVITYQTEPTATFGFSDFTLTRLA